MGLPRPGAVGIGIRLLLAAALAAMLVGAFSAAGAYWDGLADPLAPWTAYAFLLLFTSRVVNEALGTDWGLRPLAFLAIGGVIAIGVGAGQGDLFGPAFGTYIWASLVLVGGTMAVAFFLAAVLRTPGCELRAYADLWTRLRGGEPAAVACKGWIDRFDHVRLRR